MNASEILEYCLAFPAAYLDYPFGEMPACVRIRAGDKTPIFVQLYTRPGDFKVTVRCDPGVPDDELKMMFDRAYAEVVKRLPRSLQKELANRFGMPEKSGI